MFITSEQGKIYLSIYLKQKRRKRTKIEKTDAFFQRSTWPPIQLLYTIERIPGQSTVDFEAFSSPFLSYSIDKQL